VYEVLATLRPATVADLGCGSGWQARLAARLGSDVVAVDRDERQVNLCFRTARAHDLAVLPLVMNLRYPTPGFGVSNRMVAPALQRLGADLVLALGVVHEVAMGQGLALDHVVEALSSFSRHWLLIEFVPPEEAGGSPTAYSLDDLLEALSPWGRVVRIMQSSPEPRKLILCEKTDSERHFG
jgi:SAM-dependent methyltransferase